jgi:hypothetical protein
LGWYLRKSLRAGPLRFNLSKGGVGLSAGVRGARLGINARGRAYVHCGTGGVYYRSTLGTPRRATSAHSRRTHANQPPIASPLPAGTRRVIDSAPTPLLTPSTGRAVLAELRRRSKRRRLWPWLAGGFAAIAGTLFISGQSSAGLVALVGALPAVGYLWYIDRERRAMELRYDLVHDYRECYRALLDGFESFLGAHAVWLVEAETDVSDPRYHGGTERHFQRTPSRPVKAAPENIRTNILPPLLPAGRQRLYFMPDRILVYDEHGIGAVDYADVSIESDSVKLVEDLAPPRDGNAVGRTWQFVNKNGEPDRRFRDNPELPVMEYGSLHLRCGNGLNERFITSTPRAADALAAGLERMQHAARARRGSPLPLA